MVNDRWASERYVALRRQLEEWGNHTMRGRGDHAGGAQRRGERVAAGAAQGERATAAALDLCVFDFVDAVGDVPIAHLAPLLYQAYGPGTAQLVDGTAVPGLSGRATTPPPLHAPDFGSTNQAPPRPC